MHGWNPEHLILHHHPPVVPAHKGKMERHYPKYCTVHWVKSSASKLASCELSCVTSERRKPFFPSTLIFLLRRKSQGLEWFSCRVLIEATFAGVSDFSVKGHGLSISALGRWALRLLVVVSSQTLVGVLGGEEQAL